MTKLDEATLQKVALLTDGKYYRSTMGEDELDKIYEDISKLEQKEFSAREYTQYEDRYQYFLLIKRRLWKQFFIPCNKASMKPLSCSA